MLNIADIIISVASLFSDLFIFIFHHSSATYALALHRYGYHKKEKKKKIQEWKWLTAIFLVRNYAFGWEAIGRPLGYPQKRDFS